VDYTLAMGALESMRNLVGDLDRIVYRQLPFPSKPVA